ncbi:phage capsid protein [Salmonella enterica subsp. salamae]|nr:phage capsid protein [Salmonella enterica subsp. salamae]
MKRRHGRFKNPSVMNHDFSMIPSTNIQRSMFNRSSGYKTTFDAGYLIPFFVDEALPGDTFHMKTSILARLTTPIVPFMDNLKLDYFFFSVPYRLVWDNWQKFNGEQKNPGDSVDYLIPQIKAPSGGWPYASLGDYFGLPTNLNLVTTSALPFRAYNLIYNEWFRDENLINSASVSTRDDDDDSQDYPLRRRGKRHDYFTSCLPWPQKGDGVELALGTPQLVTNDDGIQWKFKSSLGNPSYPDIIGRANLDTNQSSGATETQTVWNSEIPQPFGNYYVAGYADADSMGFSISNTDALTINSLRQAFQLQRMLERDARGGTRYTEIIRSHFGVISPDSRVQRPEYLGGGTMDININPVMQTSSTDNKSPQGNLAAFGVSGAYKHGFSHSFVEHCFVIGLVCVRADLTYQQGIPRMFSRQTRYDHYWPTLAHLGEQAVLNQEIYYQPWTGSAEDDPNKKVFGYQERYAEYRYAQSKITGKMRSTDPQSLDVWHLSQKFDSLPTLNQEFIEENPPIDRVIAVQDEPQFMMDVFFDLKCARPMPTYSVPGYIDHF